ncbi:MAG TPA: hypothetical protein VED46_05200 [Alphaproteobacteria bacterium]|nr:hypothetical protein [Alphaproteobacteria bacterium]
MARIRSVKPAFWTSEQVTNCSRDARLLFIGLWNFCDDRGVHPDSPKRLKMEVFPADDMTATEVGALVEELVQVGLLARFESEEQSYLFVTGWAKHQRIDRPSYWFPAPPFADASTADRRVLGEDSSNAQGAIDEQSPPEKERKGREKEGSRKERKKEEVGARKSAAPPGGYAFSGRIIKLSARDLEQWRTSFSAIPDMEAELRAIDAKLADNPPKNGKWFGMVSAWLKSRHEKLLAESNGATAPKRGNGGFVPLGVGG